jgi:hypothetical protein
MEAEDRDVSGRGGLICSAPQTNLDLQTARAIIEPYFIAAQEKFCEYVRAAHGSPKRVKNVLLECHPWRVLADEIGFGVRNFAATSEDARTIIVAPEIVELPPETVAAIIAHEFGHVLDFIYPSDYALVGGELLRWRCKVADDDPRAEQALVARIRQWELRDPDVVEHTADEIASHVTGSPIRYSGPCLLQTFDRGSRGIRRPQGLR